MIPSENKIFIKINGQTKDLVNFMTIKFGKDKTEYFLSQYKSFLSNLRLKSDMTYEELIVVANKNAYRILNNSLSDNTTYSENMPHSFKERYPRMFLPENTPINIKILFYNKCLTIKDFENSYVLDHFKTTDLVYGLDSSFLEMANLFENNTFLTLINLVGEDIKRDCKLFAYLRRKKQGLYNLKELQEEIYNFMIKENSLKYLLVLDKLGFENEFTKELKVNLDNLIKIRPETSANSNILTVNLLSKKIIDNYGYNFISSILDYDSNASRILEKYALSADTLFYNWIKYLQNLSIYNKKLLHFAILSYENSISLIKELVESNISLNSIQLQNLLEILLQQNKYGVASIENLTNYIEFKHKLLLSKLNDSNTYEVKNAITQILFNTTLEETETIIIEYGLNSGLFTKSFLEENHILNEFELITIDLVNKIMSINNRELLINYFNNLIKNNDYIPSLIKIRAKLKSYYNKEINNSLFKADGISKPGIKYYYIPGMELSGKVNINGEKITSSKKIPVVSLEGIDFKLLIHRIHGYNYKFRNLAKEIVDDPSKWNNSEASSTISTSMISSNHIKHVGESDTENNLFSITTSVYYGFNRLPDNSLQLMGRSDISTEQGSNILAPTSNYAEFLLPDVLQKLSYISNEIVIDRKNDMTSSHNHRLQPSCIICFDGIINEESKKAALYFDIPIYMIDKEKYQERSEYLKSMYLSHNISSFDKQDVLNIFGIKDRTVEQNYHLFLSLVDEALYRGLIDFNKYKELLLIGKSIICNFKMHYHCKSIDNLDEITIRLNNVDIYQKQEFTKKRIRK